MNTQNNFGVVDKVGDYTFPVHWNSGRTVEHRCLLRVWPIEILVSNNVWGSPWCTNLAHSMCHPESSRGGVLWRCHSCPHPLPCVPPRQPPISFLKDWSEKQHFTSDIQAKYSWILSKYLTHNKMELLDNCLYALSNISWLLLATLSGYSTNITNNIKKKLSINVSHKDGQTFQLELI